MHAQQECLAKIQELKAVNAQLCAIIATWERWHHGLHQDNVEYEVAHRVSAIVPVVRERVAASMEERVASISGSARLRRNVACHVFSKDVDFSNEAALRKAHRGSRKQFDVWPMLGGMWPQEDHDECLGAAHDVPDGGENSVPSPSAMPFFDVKELEDIGMMLEKGLAELSGTLVTGLAAARSAGIDTQKVHRHMTESAAVTDIKQKTALMQVARNCIRDKVRQGEAAKKDEIFALLSNVYPEKAPFLRRLCGLSGPSTSASSGSSERRWRDAARDQECGDSTVSPRA